jgi:hypothetical protein
VPSVWVAKLHISPRTEQKINQLHGLTADEVRAAVVCVRDLRGTWHVHPERGRRALIDVTIRRQLVVVVLYPVDSVMGDEWNLGSAYPLGR